MTTLRHRIRALARQLEVRLLVIDEIHSLLAGTYREQRILLNSIRFLAHDLRLPLVCAGTHEAKQALMTDQQLADRFEAAELPAWENDSSFQQLLLSCESILPLRLPSEFRDPKVHQRILSLSEGVLVRICRLIETAATEAIHSGQEHISLGLLKDDLVTALWSRLLTVVTGASRHDENCICAISTAFPSKALHKRTLFFLSGFLQVKE